MTSAKREGMRTVNKIDMVKKIEDKIMQEKPLVSKRLGRDVTEDGLTAKQERFALLVAMGGRYAAAYRETYDCSNMADATVRSSASVLMDTPAVAKRIKDLIEERKNQSMLADPSWVRQYVFDRLLDESDKEDSSANARLKALEMLGKVDVVGMFKERSEVEATDTRTATDIEEELRRKLGGLMDRLSKSAH